MVSQEMKIAIALDLVKKYPSGPDGSFKRKDYDLIRDWHWQFERYTSIPRLSNQSVKWSAHYGWDPTLLFSLGFGSDYSARTFLQRAYETVPEKDRPKSSQALSRRARLLYYRYHNAAEYVRKNGGQGIYQIRWSSYSTNYPKAYVPALSMSEARSVGDMLKGLYGVDPECHTRVDYYAKESKVASLGMNTAQANKIKEEAAAHVAELEKRLITAKENAQKATMVASMIYQNALTLAGVDGECEDAT